MFKKLFRDKRGAAMVEYGLLVAGVALVGAAGVSTFGKKTGDLVGMMAAVLPGSQAADNGAIAVGQLIETTDASATTGPITLDAPAITTTNRGTQRLSQNLSGTNTLTTLVVEP